MRALPPTTVARLPGYLRSLGGLASEGVTTTSSDQLADLVGASPAQLRKDLSYLGAGGRRGVGYEVDHLRKQIAQALGMAEERQLVIVGIGNLGHALATYSGFADRGFVLVGLFDADPSLVGTTVAGHVVEHVDRLEEVVEQVGASIAIVATPASAAQGTTDRLVAAGVTGILNFAPRTVRVPDGVDVREVDLGSELQILGFHARRRSAQPAPEPSREPEPERTPEPVAAVD
ncbi:redox-sensing transcriptional repressor Rex [Cellulomonas hominis]|uniref:redox-sensing transcriptional repressor Rex n=1 Tax=Cellulomonas hominis TaxID=156981 RepID=UPI001B941D1D|nr:redox-sensing transcriptional repressor Rex [Cellulomonas hominis]VTR78159.1 Redox-sensing transcriptional repressor Rex [Cellulomonas hominis]